MPGDILEELRAKEEEMEALINDARKRAASIREDSVGASRELKYARRKDLEEDLKRIHAMEADRIEAEARAIEEAGRIEAEELRKKGLANLERAVEEVVRFLTPGVKGQQG